MPKNGLKLEETFLEKARESGAAVRISLANKERMTAVVRDVSRYDLGVEHGGRGVTLPKKEIYYISPFGKLLDESVLTDEPEPVSPASRSRVQDEFLNRYMAEKTLALVHMSNEDELRGVVEGYDGFTVFLRTSRGQALIYKHGICRIGPGYRRGPERKPGREDAK